MKKVRSYASVKRPHKAKPKTRITKRRVTRGGRNSDPKKLAWLRTLPCMLSDAQRTCTCGTVEVHHDRPLGAPATDKRTVPLGERHHRTGDYSIQTLGRTGFEMMWHVKMDAKTAEYEARWQAEKGRS